MQEVCFGNDRDIFLLVDTLQFKGRKYLISRNSYFFSTRPDFQNTSVKPHLSSTWGDATCPVLKQNVRRKKSSRLKIMLPSHKPSLCFVFKNMQIQTSKDDIMDLHVLKFRPNTKHNKDFLGKIQDH